MPTSSFRLAASAAVLAVAAAFSPPAAAQSSAAAAAAGPFSVLKGSWTGSGTIVQSNGATERLRCRATYQVDSDGTSLQQQLACNSDNYNFELRSQAEFQGGNISGSWTETTRNLSGSLSGQPRGTGEIRVVAQSPNFSASLAIATRGSKQTVSIRSPGTELTNVTITLDRRG